MRRAVFDQRLIRSGRFVMMSHEAQALYFSLLANCDVEGVADGLYVVKSIGVEEKALQELADNCYVVILNSDKIVHLPNWCGFEMDEYDYYSSDFETESIYHDLIVEVEGEE